MQTPSRQNMSMNSLNSTSHNAERISALADKLNQIQVRLSQLCFSLISKMKNYQNLRSWTSHSKTLETSSLTSVRRLTPSSK